MIHIHTSQTSKNSCSIVISHPYYTSFTPTYIVVVVVTVAVVTVITHYIHPYYNCLPNLVIYHQSIIPTCTAISHPYLHTYIVVVIVVTVVTHIPQLLLLLLMLLLLVEILPLYSYFFVSFLQCKLMSADCTDKSPFNAKILFQPVMK